MASCTADTPAHENTADAAAATSAAGDNPTFVFPQPEGTTVAIEFCDRCRWLHRATWVQTELFLSFPPPAITSISLFPRNAEDTTGRFRIWLSLKGNQKLVWDRKAEGGFPKLKILKQRIRDIIQPGRSLGHSDKSS